MTNPRRLCLRPRAVSRAGAGFSLVEVTVALAIAGFGLIAIFGLLPSGLNLNRVSVDTTFAASLASAVVSDIKGAARDEPSAVYKVKVDEDTSPNGEEIWLRQDGTPVAGKADAEYRATVFISKPPDAVGLRRVRLVISWPAIAANPPNNFEVVTALDRF